MTIEMPIMPTSDATGTGKATVEKGQKNGVFAMLRSLADGQSTEEKTAFVDFVMARVDALQMSEKELAAVQSKSGDKNTLSTTQAVLASLLNSEILTPQDAVKAIEKGTLSQFPKDALQAIKDLSKAVVDAHEKGLITLDDSTLESFQMLASLNIEKQKEIVPVDLVTGKEEDEDEKEEEKVAVANRAQEKTAGPEKFTLPASLVEAFDKLGLIDDSQKENIRDDGSIALSKDAFKNILAKLKEEIKNPGAETQETALVTAVVKFIEHFKEIAKGADKKEENDIAALMNAITPGAPDNADTKAVDAATPGIQNTQTGPAGVQQVGSKQPVQETAKNINEPEQYEWRNSQQNSGQGKSGDTPPAQAQAQSSTGLPFGQHVRMNTPAGLKSSTAAGSFIPGSENGEGLDGDMSFSLIKEAGHAKAASQAAAAARHSAPQSPATQQVSMHIQKAVSNGETKINIKLHPEDLGRVDVKLEFSKDGQMKATLIAEKPETLNMLQRDAAHLQKALNDAGLETNAQDLSFQLQQHHQEAQNNNPGSQNQNGSAGPALSGDGEDIAVPQGHEDIITPYRVDYRV